MARPGPHDFTRPSGPGTYNCLLDQADCLPADEALVAELTDPEKGYAGLRALARANRAFVLKAAAWTASMLSITQFLDLGCGLPLTPSVHGTVQGPEPEAVVAYVDSDPLVVSHVQAVAASEGWTGTAVVQGDASDPASVLADEGVRGLLDLSRPACVILGSTLSAMTADEARGAVKGFTAALAPRSAVIISCVSFADEATGARLARVFGDAGEWRNHPAPDVASFFGAGGLRVIRGRPGDVRCWPLLPEADGDAAVLGGIGVKD